MKYRGIELKEGNEFENEFAIGVQISEDCNLDMDDIEELIDDEICESFRLSSHADVVMDEYCLIRSWDIEFNQKGVDALKELYDKAVDLFKGKKGVEVFVDIHLNEWFVSEETGNDCNNDEVKWEEFIERLEMEVK